MSPVHQRALAIRANALMFTKGDVLADFERELVREVYSRPDITVTTAAEWAVINDAVAAMEAAPRQDLTDVGQAA